MPTNSQLPPSIPARSDSIFVTLFSLAVLIGVYALFDFGISQASQLPESAYRAPFVFLQFLRSLGWRAILMSVPFLIMASRTNFRLTKWDELGTIHLHIFISVLVVFLAWNFTTYDRNAYYGRWHLYDRVLIAATVPLVLWRPHAVFAFLILLVPLMNQFAHPDCMTFLWPEKQHPIHILVLFCAFLFLFNVKNRAWPFYFLLLNMVAVHYWPSGWTKLKMNWVWNNELANAIFSAHANGWMPQLDSNSIVDLHRKLGWIDFPLRLFTLIVEVAAIFFLWNRKLAMGIVVSWAALHVGIILGMGICFLNWIVVDLGILFLLCTTIPNESPRVFSRGNFAISIILIVFGSYWVQTSRFAWFDTRVCYSYRLEGTGESGKAYVIDPATMAPYNFAFTWNLFERLYQKKQLPLRYGNVRDPQAAKLVDSITSAEDLFRLEKEAGSILYDHASELKYRRFLQLFFQELNHEGHARWLRSWQRPADLIVSRRKDAYDGEEPIRSVTTHRVTTLFDGTSFRQVRAEKLMTVQILNEGEH